MNINSYNVTFEGTTKVYAFTDSHQESRKTGAIMSEILSDTKDKDNALLVYGGDMFKGVYPKELEKDTFIKLKEAKPNMEMVITLGNNDFGFFKDTFDYLINTVKEFYSKGIHTVCANMFDSNSGKRPEWMEPYTIVTRDGDRTFVTGFCIDNVGTQKFGLEAHQSTEVIDELSDAIKREKPDNVIVLNHDHKNVSEAIINKFKENDIKVDLLIGGHDHEKIEPDKELSIFYPLAYSETMYEFDLENNGDRKGITSVKEINWKDCEINSIFKGDLEKTEKELELYAPVVPSVLNLTKKSFDPSPFGTFLADNIKEKANTDIAFFSTGFVMNSIPYKPNSDITLYQIKKAIAAKNTILQTSLNTADLKSVFENALKNRKYSVSNPKFLQCSGNIKLIYEDDALNKICKLKQICINGEELLNKNGEPIDSKKMYTCAIDNYIADGGQGYNVLKEKNKSPIVLNGKEMKINEIFEQSLFEAVNKYEKGYTYPSFELIE